MKHLLSWLRILRWPNITLIFIFLYVFRYGFLLPQSMSLYLGDLNYFLLAISLSLITAAGYIINDIQDQGIDALHPKKKVWVGALASEETAYNVYVALNILGVGIGFWIANEVNKPAFGIYFVLLASLSYLYATYVKGRYFFGNLLVALMVFLGVSSILLFDLLPLVPDYFEPKHAVAMSVLFDYAIFAFITTWIREIIKDLEDHPFDATFGLKSMPIWIGVKKTKMVLMVLMTILTIIVLQYIHSKLLFNGHYISTFYLYLTVVAPILWSILHLWKYNTSKEYHKMSTVYKFILLFGILSVAIVNYQVMHHVE
ncbi:MAG: geranylgeranylglycerol-phosphate geranylgeranyltransferase [Flavobacterium sp.]